MCMEGTPMTAEPPDCAPTSRLVDRITNLNPRHAAISGLTFWVGGIIVFLLHILGFWQSQRGFVIADTWLIAAGCLGMPVHALRALGRYLTPNACLVIVAFMFGCGLLLTGLTVAGEMRPTAPDIAFGLIMFLAPGVQAFNAVDGLTRAHHGYQKGAEDTRRVMRADFDSRLQYAETVHRDRETALREQYETQLGDLRQQLAEAQAAAEQRYDEGVTVGIEACRLEIQRRAEALEEAGTPLADVVALRVAKKTQPPLQLVRERDPKPLPTANGHDPANHAG
jgi:hypothetical protein